jgi:hypothetical protein
VHIAAKQGHIILVELMLALKVQAEDVEGKSAEDYANKSQHTFAQEWAAEREKPAKDCPLKRALEENIKLLLQLVKAADARVEALKCFIVSSKCLDVETWRDCGYSSFDAKGPMECSLGDILHDCCSSESPDQAFILWLCTRLYCFDGKEYSRERIHEFWGGEYDVYSFLHDEENEKIFQTLNRNDLLSFAENSGYHDIVHYIQQTWFKDIACVDPLTRNLLLKSALGEGELLLRTRAHILRAGIFIKMARILRDAFAKLIMQEGRSAELEEIIRIDVAVKKHLVDEGFAAAGYKYDFRDISLAVRQIDMSTHLHHVHDTKYQGQHKKQLAFMEKRGFFPSQMHVVLATEGLYEPLQFCLRMMSGWTAEMELDVVRLAAFYGHSSILDLLLTCEGLLSNKTCRLRQALLGFGECCRSRDLLQVLDVYGAIYVPDKDERVSSDDSNERYDFVFNKSLVCTVLNGYSNEFFDPDTDSLQDLKSLRMLVDKFNYAHKDILYSITAYVHYFGLSRCIVDLLQNVFEALNFEPIFHSEQMRALCSEVFTCIREKKNTDDENPVKRVLEWLGEMADLGIDIQNISPKRYFSGEFCDRFRELEKRQREHWSRLDVIHNGGSLHEIRDVIERDGLPIHGRYKGGQMLTHLSAACNRVDVLEWLIVTKGLHVHSKDGQGRSVLETAKASRATCTTKWIVERQARRTVVSFMQRYHACKPSIRKRERLVCAALSLQKKYRGYSVRKMYRGSLVERLEASQHFSMVWGAFGSLSS